MVVVAFDQVDPSNLLATMAGRDERAPMVRQIGDGRVRAARNNIEARLVQAAAPDLPLLLATRCGASGRLSIRAAYATGADLVDLTCPPRSLGLVVHSAVEVPVGNAAAGAGCLTEQMRHDP